MDLKQELMNVFFPKKDFGGWESTVDDNEKSICTDNEYVNFSKKKKDNREYYEITVGSMYTAVGVGLKKLLKLVEMFGTEEIDVDDFSYGGCETCDYGSDYGHTLQLYNVTKRIDELEQLCKQED